MIEYILIGIWWSIGIWFVLDFEKSWDEVIPEVAMPVWVQMLIFIVYPILLFSYILTAFYWIIKSL